MQCIITKGRHKDYFQKQIHFQKKMLPSHHYSHFVKLCVQNKDGSCMCKFVCKNDKIKETQIPCIKS